MKETFYFSHDANARHDPKIVKMMLDFKAEGYGIFWCIIEMLRNEPSYKLKLSNIDAIAYQSHSDIETVEKIIKNYDLFKISENEFYSASLFSRMGEYKIKCEKARNSANIRWNNANAMPTQCEGNAIKESKVNKRKEKSVSDSDFLDSLKTNKAYQYFDVETELAKMDAWLLSHPGRQKTRKFITNWLNRIETPLPISKPKTRIIA